MKKLIFQLFTWWNGQTLGTRFYTWRKGKLVGEDQFGNKYFTDKKKTRRWVVYNGLAEASKIPPGWHGWIHHRTDSPPPDESYEPRSWQKEHQENHTGTVQAYRPSGSILTPESRPRVTGDYEAWSPENQ